MSSWGQAGKTAHAERSPLRMSERIEAHVAGILRERCGTALGAIRVGGVDFVYFMGPYHPAEDDNPYPVAALVRSSSWYVGIDDRGFRHAGTFGPHESLPSDRFIHGALAAIAQGPPGDPDRIWETVSRTVMHSHQGMDEIECLVSRVLLVAPDRPSTPEEMGVRGWSAELASGVRERIGLDRFDLLARTRFHEDLRDERRKARGGKVVEPAPLWHLRSDKAQVQAAMGLMERNAWFDWGFATAERPEDLDGDDDAVVRRLLETHGVGAAKARRAGPWCGWLHGPGVRAMRALPIDAIPRREDEKEWRNFLGAAMMVERLGVHEEGRIATLLAGAKGRWAAYVERLMGTEVGPNAMSWDPAPRGEEGIGTLMWKAGNVRDMVEEFAIALPLLDEHDYAETMPEVSERMAEAAVVGDKGMVSLTETSDEWHAAFKTPTALAMEWEPVLPAWTHARTRLSIVPLASSDDLAAEGSRKEDGLDHCVGGVSYAIACVQGTTRIVSVRYRDRRLSTAEIAMGTGEVVQHRGYGNANPPDSAERALRAYLRTPAVKDLVLRPAPKGELPPGVQDRTNLRFEEALDEWRPFLAGRWRTAASEEFYGPMGLVPPGGEEDPAP